MATSPKQMVLATRTKLWHSHIIFSQVESIRRRERYCIVSYCPRAGVDRTGKISGSTDRANRGPCNKKKNNIKQTAANILLMQCRTSLVNRKFITRLN